MGTFLTLDEVKDHLNIERDYTDEDTYLSALIDTAEMSVMCYLNRSYEDLAIEYGGDVPSPVVHAAKLEVGTLYGNRESVSYASPKEVPLTYKHLLATFRKY